LRLKSGEQNRSNLEFLEKLRLKKRLPGSAARFFEPLRRRSMPITRIVPHDDKRCLMLKAV